MSKSAIVGINCAEDEVHRLANRLGCSMGGWPLSFLGLLLAGNPYSESFWSLVIDRVWKILDGWKIDLISNVGRLVSNQLVLSSIPIYLFVHF